MHFKAREKNVTLMVSPQTELSFYGESKCTEGFRQGIEERMMRALQREGEGDGAGDDISGVAVSNGGQIWQICGGVTDSTRNLTHQR